jgi:hypothetical protein
MPPWVHPDRQPCAGQRQERTATPAQLDPARLLEATAAPRACEPRGRPRCCQSSPTGHTAPARGAKQPAVPLPWLAARGATRVARPPSLACRWTASQRERSRWSSHTPCLSWPERQEWALLDPWASQPGPGAAQTPPEGAVGSAGALLAHAQHPTPPPLPRTSGITSQRRRGTRRSSQAE